MFKIRAEPMHVCPFYFAAGGTVFVWDVLQFSGASLILFVACTFVNWFVFTMVSYLVRTKLWAVALYLAAFDGPLRYVLSGIWGNMLYSNSTLLSCRNLLFSGLTWVTWSAYLPPFLDVKQRVLTLLMVVATVDAAKELMLKIFKGRVTRDQFKTKLMSIVDRMITLQNLSALAVSVSRARKMQKKAGHKVAMASSGMPPLGRERQHSTIGPLTPVTKLMQAKKVSHFSLDRPPLTKPERNEQIPPNTEGVNDGESIVVDVQSSNGGDDTNTTKPKTASASLPPTVDANDLREVDNSENRFHILANEVRKGRFKLFDGTGSIVTINNGSTARKVAASIFSQLDIDNKGVVSVQDLLKLPGTHSTEDEAEETLAKLGQRVSKQIDRRAFIIFATTAHSDFRGLGSTLKSYSVITRAVRMVLNIVFVTFVFIFSLLLFRVSPSAVLIPAATLLVSLSFALGTTAVSVNENELEYVVNHNSVLVLLSAAEQFYSKPCFYPSMVALQCGRPSQSE